MGDPADLAEPQTPEPVTIPNVRLSGAQSLAPATWPGVRPQTDIPLWALFAIAIFLGGGWGLGWLTLTSTLAGVAVALFWSGLLWLIQMQAQRKADAAWDASRFGAQPVTWRFSAKGIEQTGPYLYLSVPWSAFPHADLTRQGFVFTLTPTSSLVLPITGLTGDQKAAVSAWLIWANREGGPMDDPR